MKIAVTGATGFVGKALTNRLISRGVDVIAVVRQNTDLALLHKKAKVFIDGGCTQSLIDEFASNKIDGIIHLASLFLSRHNIEDLEGLIQSNLLFGTRLLEAAARCKVRWFINTGTFWQHLNNAEYDPVNLYAATKQAFEDIACYYSKSRNIDFVTIKLNDTFGPDDTRPKIFNLWARIAKSGDSLNMSPGEQLMDICYIDNVTDAYMGMIALVNEDEEHKFSGKSFAVSSNERLSLRELAKLFEKATGTTLAINWGKQDYRPREVMVPWNKGVSVPGWKQRVSLLDGIKQTMNQKEL